MHTQSPAEKRGNQRDQLTETEGFRAYHRLLEVGIQQDYPRAARDVPPGECWAFVDHRTMAEMISESLL